MSNPSTAIPLIVDLDGSLIKTDILHESIIKLFYTKPWLVLMLPIWLISGKAYLKEKLNSAVEFDIPTLPWNQDLIDFLQEEHSRGREIILCTGSWHTIARDIAEHFHFISSHYGTNTKKNLTGTHKAHLLLDKYGEGNFDYVGNSPTDFKVWQHCNRATIVSNSKKFCKKVSNFSLIEKTIPSRKKNVWKLLLKQIRVHQWVKNALIFVPLITSHQISNTSLLIDTLLAFIAFGFCASATYIINDLSDLESDRKNSTKRFRPLASGDLSIPTGIAISIIMMLISITIAIQLSEWFIWSLLTYILITLSYSFKLKRLQSLDITVLAGLYTLRIIAGAAAINVLPSFWLLAFSMFIFLCLALIKRLSEIINNKARYTEQTKLSGRGYYISDLQVLLSLATASGMLSILVFAMYINSPETLSLYQEPYVLWLLCPLLTYWITRIIIMASRGHVDEDPILFAIKDIHSWVTGSIILLIIFAASL